MGVTEAPIRSWHVVISGFLQDEGEPTGMVSLWRRLRRLSDAETCVELRNWNDNWRQFAELIWRMRPADCEPDVRIYAYSYGGGWGAMQLARQLKRRGIGVRVMVLSDPVFRSPWLLLRWLSLVSYAFIVVPDNVRNVIWFRQTTNRPAGHHLIAQNPDRTRIAESKWVEVAHQYMDDLPEFHEACEEEARRK
jgi:pimeloyl-ACP methyl ester carboxylesterase